MPPTNPAQSPANAVPSTALHLLTSTRPPESQTNRSTAPANRSIRFTSLRFHSVLVVSAVQRKETRIGAALRSAPFAQPIGRANQLSLARTALIPATPDPKSHRTAHCKPSPRKQACALCLPAPVTSALRHWHH